MYSFPQDKAEPTLIWPVCSPELSSENVWRASEKTESDRPTIMMCFFEPFKPKWEKIPTVLDYTSSLCQNIFKRKGNIIKRQKLYSPNLFGLFQAINAELDVNEQRKLS